MYSRDRRRSATPTWSPSQRFRGLDVPDDVGLELVSMGLEKRPLRGGEVDRAQGLERVADAIEVGARRLDFDPGTSQPLDCGAADLEDTGLDGQVGRVEADRHPARRHTSFRGVQIRTFGRRQGDRVLAIRPDERVEQERRVGDVATHRPVHAQGVEAGLTRPEADDARRRPHPDHGTERGRRPQRPTQVRTRREPDLAGGERHGRTARRSTGVEPRVPRVEGLAEDLVEGVGTRPELGRVGLAQDDPAVGLEALDHDVGSLRDVVGVDRRAVGRPDTGHVGQVLDARPAGQPAARAQPPAAPSAAGRARAPAPGTASRTR